MAANIAMPGMRSQRKLRSPVHPFQISQLPFHIVPFFIAPVLPGETMKNLMIQSRAVTDPIKNPLVGWWMEYYFFYVKHSDLYPRDELREMVINPAWTTTDVTNLHGTTASRDSFYSGGTDMIDWSDLCYHRVVDEYFRDEDETWQQQRFIDVAATGRTYSLARIVGDSAFDSVSLTDDETAQDVNLIDAATTDVLTASEVDTGMRLWQQQRLYNITELTYEDWLKTFGINAPAVEDPHKPELLRYLREWQYPTNTIDPTNGTPRSAVSWSIRDRADKNRRFTEPGFIYGVSVCRPKVYIRQQEGSFTSLLNDWKAWLPALFAGDPNLSRKTVPTDRGPLQTVVTDAEGYVVDLADLFLYGEHFTNHDRADTNRNFLNTVAADLSRTLYPTDINAIIELFVDPTTNLQRFVRQDGVVSLTIAMNAINPVLDYSPRGGNRSQETSGGGF